MVTSTTSLTNTDVNQVLTNKVIDGDLNTITNSSAGAWLFVERRLMTFTLYQEFTLPGTANYKLVFDNVKASAVGELSIQLGSASTWWETNEYLWTIRGFNGGSMVGQTYPSAAHFQLTRDGVEATIGVCGSAIIGPFNSSSPATLIGEATFIMNDSTILASLQSGGVMRSGTNATRMRVLWDTEIFFAGGGYMTLYSQML